MLYIYVVYICCIYISYMCIDVPSTTRAYQVSMPTGSVCAERSCIANALASDFSLSVLRGRTLGREEGDRERETAKVREKVSQRLSLGEKGAIKRSHRPPWRTWRDAKEAALRSSKTYTEPKNMTQSAGVGPGR